jgi:hypothetical protein
MKFTQQNGSCSIALEKAEHNLLKIYIEKAEYAVLMVRPVLRYLLFVMRGDK